MRTELGILAIIPLIVTIVLLLKRKPGPMSMLVGAGVGLAIYIGANISNVFSIWKIAKDIFEHTVLSNWALLASVVVLTVLCEVICRSDAMESLTRFTIARAQDENKVAQLILSICICFGLDDYLAAFTASGILRTPAKRIGVSPAQVAMMVNLGAVSIACVSPISSWAPVIQSYIAQTGLPPSMLYWAIPFNFVALLGIGYLVFKSMAKRKQVKNTEHICTHRAVLNAPMKRDLSLIVLILLTLIGFFTIFTVLGIANPLLWSSLIALIVAQAILYRKNTNMNRMQLPSIINSAVGTSFSLVYFLLAAWTMSYVINNGLGLGNYIASISTQLNIGHVFVPAILFAVCALFSHVSGSSFGSMSIFIPIAVSLTSSMQNEAVILSLGAVLAGSLIAASSRISDTLKICCDCLHVTEDAAYRHQLVTFIKICIASFAAFICAAAVMQFGYAVMLVVGASVALLIMFIFSITDLIVFDVETIRRETQEEKKLRIKIRFYL